MEQYIGESIESILKQSFSDFEFIIIDDASTDSTRNIIQSYRDSRITVLHNDVNTGNYPSRNRGMKIARGKYVAVMDGDDFSFPERFMTQYAFMENHPDVLACGSFNTLVENIMKRPLNYEDVLFALLNNNCFFHSSLFIRNKTVREINYYNEDYVYASDYSLVCSLAVNGKIEILPETLIRYRFHPAQITRLHRHEQRRFANQVRRKYQLAMIERHQCERIGLPNEADLSFPAMGRIIFFCHYAGNSHSAEYGKMANDLLHKIVKAIRPGMPVCLEEGLSGLCCGLIYLLRNSFIEIEESLLNVIDNYIEAGYPHLDDDDFYCGKRGVDYYREQFHQLKKICTATEK
jgi:glycosyltransferase involved in cell wall biosynthesis